MCRAGEIEPLIDLSRAVPAEFAADSLIRIASLEQTAKARKIELLQAGLRACRSRAASLQDAVRRRRQRRRGRLPQSRLPPGPGRPDTAPPRRSRHCSPLDPQRARELFLQIPPLELPPLTCAQNQAYDVALFYRVLGSVAAQPAAGFVDRYMAAIASPSQVGPAARMLSIAALGDAPFRAAVTAFAVALRSIGPDDRSFSVSAGAGPDLLALVEACRNRGVPAVLVVDAYRHYLVGHLSGERCADSALPQSNSANVATGLAIPSVITDARSADAVGLFNEKMRVPPVKAIERYETYPSKTEGAAATSAACDDAACQAVRDGYRHLIFNSIGLAYTTDDRAKPEWRDQLPALLDQLAQWKDGETADADASFAAKCGFYNDLAGMAVLPEDRDAIYRAMVDFLKRSTLRASNRMEWFLPLNALIARRQLIDELSQFVRRHHRPLRATRKDRAPPTREHRAAVIKHLQNRASCSGRTVHPPETRTRRMPWRQPDRGNSAPPNGAAPHDRSAPGNRADWHSAETAPNAGNLSSGRKIGVAQNHIVRTTLSICAVSRRKTCRLATIQPIPTANSPRASM